MANESAEPAPGAMANARLTLPDEPDLAHLQARAFDAGGATLRDVGERALLDALVRQVQKADGLRRSLPMATTRRFWPRLLIGLWS